MDNHDTILTDKFKNGRIKMAEEKKEKAIRDYVDALEKKDVDRALAFFTDDATWTTNEGIFKGTEEIRNYTRWMLETLTDLTFTDDGIGIIVEGNKAVYQHIYEGTNEGNRIKANSICIYQFDGDKCNNHYSIADRLSMVRQAATGPFARIAVNSIIKRMEKGLR